MDKKVISITKGRVPKDHCDWGVGESRTINIDRNKNRELNEKIINRKRPDL